MGERGHNDPGGAAPGGAGTGPPGWSSASVLARTALRLAQGRGCLSADSPGFLTALQICPSGPDLAHPAVTRGLGRCVRLQMGCLRSQQKGSSEWDGIRSCSLPALGEQILLGVQF